MLLLMLFVPCVVRAEDSLVRVAYRDNDGRQQIVSGRILVEAVDGGLMLQTPDGAITTIEAELSPEKKETNEKFVPLTAQALGEQLLQEFGAPFELTFTKHYVICSDADKQYARWCGALFERLYAGFGNYWSKRGLKLPEPTFPLSAIVFADQKRFAAYATADAGPDSADAKGYYSLKTNRIVLYDLTGKAAGRRAQSIAQINRAMTRAPFNTATVVHEATHQIAFNRRMHTRYADNPLWMTEGMAMYFETPDLNSRSGWRTIGRVNPFRIKRFRQTLANPPPQGCLLPLIHSDALFHNEDSSPDAYANAWALSYFLIKTRSDDYLKYLKILEQKPRLIPNSAEERVADFRGAFGEDLAALERDWLRYLRRAK